MGIPLHDLLVRVRGADATRRPTGATGCASGLWSRAWSHPVTYRASIAMARGWGCGPWGAAGGRGACPARAATGPTSATCPTRWPPR